MAKALPKPFKYRGGWRAQVTCENDTRPVADFAVHEDAKKWIVDTLANANSAHEPELGGPTQATLAQALKHYATLYTVAKGGVESARDLWRLQPLRRWSHEQVEQVLT